MSHFEITTARNIDHDLNCLRLQLEAGNEIDHTVSASLGNGNTIYGVEWCVKVPFTSIRSFHHILRSNYCVPCTT